jgi:tRNA nucleotidyltransferase/poly(A) polymerase
MPISKEIIDRTLATKHGEAAFAVCEKILDAGEECYWIGGAVRDMMLGKIPKEIDIATSALPEKIEKLFPRSDVSAALLGTVIVSLQGEVFEITTFREDDAASDGRHPESVKFGSKEKDAERRDATINAMYWNPVSREFFDPCGGEADIRALRILRMVRLRATINGQYEPKTYKALAKKAELTKILSGTRILEELEKLLKTDRPHVGLEDLWELRVLEHTIPELHVCKGIAQPAEFHQEGDVWNHLLRCVSKFTEDHGPDVRLAALFHDIGKAQTFAIKERIRFDHHAEASADSTTEIFKRLQMPGERIKKLDWLIRHHMMMASFEKLTPERKAHWYFHPWFRELLELFWLDATGTDPGDYTYYDWIINDYNEFLNARPRPPKPLLKGDEVMEILGVGPGAVVGEALKALHDAQIKKEVTTKEEAKEFLKQRALPGRD